MTYLVSEDFRVDHVGCVDICLIRGQEDLDVAAARRLGQSHMQLAIRGDQDLKINTKTSGGLTLELVDGR